MRKRSQNGFSLVELLIVIAVVGILAAVLVPNLLAARTRAFDTATQACGKAIATAQVMHVVDDGNDSYAAAPEALDANMIATCTDTPITIAHRNPFDGDGWALRHPMPGTKEFLVSADGIREAPVIERGTDSQRGRRRL